MAEDWTAEPASSAASKPANAREGGGKSDGVRYGVVEPNPCDADEADQKRKAGNVKVRTVS